MAKKPASPPPAPKPQPGEPALDTSVPPPPPEPSEDAIAALRAAIVTLTARVDKLAEIARQHYGSTI